MQWAKNSPSAISAFSALLPVTRAHRSGQMVVPYRMKAIVPPASRGQ